jgi:DNA-binding transcriptional MerR regulator
MLIGELGAQADVPPKTIRYYEQIGILREPARTPAGYRDYDGSALERLRFIKTGQALGFTLGELKEILAFRDRDEVPCQHVANLIDQRVRMLSQYIKDLRQLRGELEDLADRARKAPGKGKGGYCHIIESGRTTGHGSGLLGIGRQRESAIAGGVSGGRGRAGTAHRRGDRRRNISDPERR